MNLLREISLCTTGILKFNDVTFRGHGSFEKKNFCCKIELFVVRSKIFQMLQIYLEKIWNILKSILWQILPQFNRFLQLRGLKVPKKFPKNTKMLWQPYVWPIQNTPKNYFTGFTIFYLQPVIRLLTKIWSFHPYDFGVTPKKPIGAGGCEQELKMHFCGFFWC